MRPRRWIYYFALEGFVVFSALGVSLPGTLLFLSYNNIALSSFRSLHTWQDHFHLPISAQPVTQLMQLILTPFQRKTFGLIFGDLIFSRQGSLFISFGGLFSPFIDRMDVDACSSIKAQSFFLLVIN